MTPCYQRHELAPGVHVDVPHEHEGVAVKTMAEVIRDHWAMEVPPLTYLPVVKCMSDECEWTGRFVGDIAEHVEAELAAAGFGPVKAATAGALREAVEDMVKERPILVAPWLRARAATIEDGS